MMNVHCEPIPEDFPVQPLITPEQIESAGCVATCGHCGHSWDDSQQTEWTPAPSARCPFECFHIEDEEDDDTGDEFRIVVSLDLCTLRRQKEVLVGLLMSDDSGLSQKQLVKVDGIVELLDHIQDQIVDTEQATSLEVFGFES